MKRLFMILAILTLIVSMGFIPTPKKYIENVYLKINNVHKIYSGLIILESFEIKSNKDTILLIVNYNSPAHSDYLRIKAQPDNLKPDEDGYYHYSMIDDDCFLTGKRVFEVYSPNLLQLYEVGKQSENDQIVVHYYNDSTTELNF